MISYQQYNNIINYTCITTISRKNAYYKCPDAVQSKIFVFLTSNRHKVIFIKHAF